MEIALFLLHLLQMLRDPQFGPDQAVAIVGDPVRKDARHWYLQPRNDEFSEAVLYFENIPAGDGLLTTIGLRWKEPWQPTLEELRQIYGPEDRWLPSTGPRRSRTLQFYWDDKPLKGFLLFEVQHRPAGSETDRLIIPSVRIRRMFGSQPKPAGGEDALTGAV